MRRSISRYIAVLMFVLAGVLSTPAIAQGRPAPSSRAGARASEKVEIQLMVVYATDTHSNIDSRLSALTRYLSHMRFTGYELLDTKTASLGIGSKQSFSIQGNRTVEVELLSKDDRRVRMRVQVTSSKGGKLLDTTLSVNQNGTFIVAGPKHKDGILVLPLTARY